MSELTRAERIRESSGKRTKFKGKRGIMTRSASGKMRFSVKSSTHGGSKQATGGFSCGEQFEFKGGVTTRECPGAYKVMLTGNKSRQGGEFGNPPPLSDRERLARKQAGTT